MRILPNRLGKEVNKALIFYLLFGRSHPQPRLVLAVYISLSHIGMDGNDEFSDQQAVIRPSENANAPNGDSKRSEFKIHWFRALGAPVRSVEKTCSVSRRDWRLPSQTINDSAHLDFQSFVSKKGHQ